MSFFEIIKEDFLMPKKEDPAFESHVELFFNYPGVWALINYRLSHALHQKGFKTLSRMISGISQFLTNVDIHPAAMIGRRVFLDHASGIVIGSTSIIGDDVLIYQGVTLGGVSLQKNTKRHPTIKNGVVIGSGAKILGNIVVGENSRIGSNSVVIKDIPPNCTAVGVPARPIVKNRTDECKAMHNELPDITKSLIIYLTKRVHLLEECLCKDSEEYSKLTKQDKELENLYEEFIKAIKD